MSYSSITVYDVVFIVNHQYQLVSALKHAHDLKEQGLTVGYVFLKHSDFDYDEAVRSTTIFDSSDFSHGNWLVRYSKYIWLYALLLWQVRKIKVKSVFLFSELDLANHISVSALLDKETSLYLLEDGGLASYLPLIDMETKGLNFKERVKYQVAKILPGVRSIRPYRLNQHLFFRINDAFFDGFISYCSVRNRRLFPVFVVDKPGTVKLSPVKGTVLFLSEPLYEEYSTFDEYLECLYYSVSVLSLSYSEVIFKFHPRERDDVRRKVRLYLSDKGVDIKYSDFTGPAEMLVEKSPPEVVASFFAATLLAVKGTGVKSLYLFNCFDCLMKHAILKNAERVLEEIGYKFANIEGDYLSEFGFSRDIQQTSALAQVLKVGNIDKS